MIRTTHCTRARGRASGFLFLFGAACAAGCSPSAGGPKSVITPVFGGQGATIAPVAKEVPLAPDTPSQANRTAGPCGGPSRPADLALLDDFEDGDNHLFKGFERDGYWFSHGDATDGANVSPEPDRFVAERLPSSESTPNNLFAAHFKASGQRDWGAVWGTTLQWESKGVRCPLNASAFAGVRFRARGPATIRVNFGMPETQAADTGGTCTAGCYDYHGKVVVLADRWADYFVPWDRVQQGGWGTQVRFDPARIVNLTFLAMTRNLPADFWVDDVQFVTPHEAEALVAADSRPLAAAIAK